MVETPDWCGSMTNRQERRAGERRASHRATNHQKHSFLLSYDEVPIVQEALTAFIDSSEPSPSVTAATHLAAVIAAAMQGRFHVPD